MIVALLLLRQDAVVASSAYRYHHIVDLKIEWRDLLKQQNNEYEVYFYSTSCQFCLDLEEDIVTYALTGGGNLFFIEVTPYLPFGPLRLECACDISCLRLPAYPALLTIRDGCVSGVIIGSGAIGTYYGFSAKRDGL